MIDTWLNRAERNLEDLGQQVGRPAVPHMPQTTNQAIVVVLEDLTKALRHLQEKVEST